MVLHNLAHDPPPPQKKKLLGEDHIWSLVVLYKLATPQVKDTVIHPSPSYFSWSVNLLTPPPSIKINQKKYRKK